IYRQPIFQTRCNRAADLISLPSKALIRIKAPRAMAITLAFIPSPLLPPERRMTTEAARLRQRAHWYREFAKLGTLHEQEWRGQMADYFDRLADQAEKNAETPPAKNH